MGSRKMKTCRRRGRRQRPTSGLHSTASASSPCLAAKMPCSGRRCCLRKNVFLQVMRRSFRLDPRPAIRETTKLCFHAFQVLLQRRCGARNRLRVRLRSRHLGDAAAMATEGLEDWAESEQKGLFGYATGSRCPCLLPCQCVRVRARARVCIRVFSWGLLFSKVSTVSNVQKVVSKV